MRNPDAKPLTLVALWAASSFAWAQSTRPPSSSSSSHGPLTEHSPSVQAPSLITPNFKNVDIRDIAEAVSTATGKTLILDPRVRGQVTMFSSTALSPAAFYVAFQAILQVHGFVAVPAGNVVKILPDANASTVPSVTLPEETRPASDEIVTQVIEVKNVSAARLAPILRPLVPSYGHVAAFVPSNLLVISDRQGNMNRLISIVHRLDQADAPQPPPRAPAK